MYLNNELDNFIAVLKNSGSFDNVKILKAFPDVMKPTKLNKAVVAVSPGEIDVQNISVGGRCFYGSYTINADIFVPRHMGIDNISDIIENIIKVYCVFSVIAISASQIIYDTQTCSYNAKCSFTFNGKID